MHNYELMENQGDASALLAVGGHRFDKFHLIEHTDPHAGFCTLVTNALNGVRRALANNWLPIVNYDDRMCTYFFDAAHGPNMWEYYFEPVMGVSYSSLQALLQEGLIPPSLIHTFEARDVYDAHLHDPQRIATFWSGETPADPAAWMASKRQLGRTYVSRYLRVRPHIRAAVDGFVSQWFQPLYTFGVHIRGTDFAYAEPTGPDAYFRAIHAMANARRQEDFRVFLATDQEQFVHDFQREFGDRLVHYASARSASDVPTFLLQDVGPYKKGEDVLVDILLLSRCDHILKCAAAGGEYALWFNDHAACTDFALGSRWNPTFATTGFLTLNVGGAGRVKHRASLWWNRAKHGLLHGTMAIGRRVLPEGLRDWLWTRLGRRLLFSGHD